MSGFRDLHPRFAGANAQVLGISMDDLATQKKFAASLKLPFPLLADAGGKTAKDYGVAGSGYAERVTFVISSDGKIEKVVEGDQALDPTPSLDVCEMKAKKKSAP